MRKNLTEIIDIFQSIAVQPKNLIVENNRQHAAAGSAGDKQRINTSSSANNSFDFTPPVPSAAAKPPQTGGEYLRETWDEIKKLSDSRISKDKLVYNNNGDSRRSKRSSEFSGGNGKSTSAGKDSKKSGKKHANDCRTNFPHLGGGSSSKSRANNGDKHGNGVGGNQCDCLPVIEMLGRRIETDRTEILTSLAERNKVMDTRLTQLESKTRRQIASFNQTMKVKNIWILRDKTM